VTELIILEPHGFCDGVKRAIQKLDQSLKSNLTSTISDSHSQTKTESPTINLAYNQIVHNKKIVEDFQSQGVIFVQSFDEIEEYTNKYSQVNLFISAHGISPKLLQKLQTIKNLNIIDATCPLVYKVHQIVDQYLEQNYQIFYLGKKNHEETKGILGHSDSIYLIENSHDIEHIPESIKNNSQSKVYLCQTTLSVHDSEKVIQELKNALPEVEDPPNSTICYATTQRQAAIKEIKETEGLDLLLVIGSANSSNSQNLLKTAQNLRIPNAFLIDDLEDLKKIEQNLDFTKFQKIGLTSGASTPEILLNEIKDHLKKYL